jgi:hypothetical protein
VSIHFIYLRIKRKELSCIETGTGSTINTIVEIAGTSTISKERFNRVFNSYILPSSLLIGDSAKAYRNFVSKYSIDHEFIPTGKHKSKSGYTLSRVNEKHSSIKLFLKPYKGVSIRHLSNYLSLYLYMNSNTKEDILTLINTKRIDYPTNKKILSNNTSFININSIYQSKLIQDKYIEKKYNISISRN